MPEIHTGEIVASADKRQTAELLQNGKNDSAREPCRQAGVLGSIRLIYARA